MKKYDFIYIVVLYKNIDDMNDLRESIIRQNQSYRIILVNNYADEKSLNDARKFALEFSDIDLVEEDNKGYGAGNNAGIEFAIRNYEFDYIIISNPDTIIEQFNVELLDLPSESIIYAPEITCCSGKKQNPNWAFYSALIEKLQYEACKKGNQALDYVVIMFLKLFRIFYQQRYKKAKRKEIYSAHGAFLILSNTAVKKMFPLYDENMFLFYEEVYLANRAKEHNIVTLYVPGIKIFHKEDGSVKLTNINKRKIAHESVVYYYEHKR